MTAAPTAKKSYRTSVGLSEFEPLVAELERLAPLSAEIPEDLREAISEFVQSYRVDQVVEGDRVFRPHILPPFKLAAAALRALHLNLLRNQDSLTDVTLAVGEAGPDEADAGSRASVEEHDTKEG